jgi:SAM-dependent methyltransferase
MPTLVENVSKLYGNIAELENRRLLDHPMERELTLRAIRKALSGSPSNPTSSSKPKRIADIGGGPGKLAFLLADEGHHVDLVDLSPDLIRLAQAEQDRRRALHGITSPTATDSGSNAGGNKTENKKPALLRSISVGNALTLDTHPVLGTDQELHADGTYDAVLLLGPLYHLLEESERATAVKQALRLAKPGGEGVVFVAFVSVAAHLRDVAVREPGRLVGKRGFYGKYVSWFRFPPSSFMSFCFQVLFWLPRREGVISGQS